MESNQKEKDQKPITITNLALKRQELALKKQELALEKPKNAKNTMSFDIKYINEIDGHVMVDDMLDESIIVVKKDEQFPQIIEKQQFEDHEEEKESLQ